MSTKGDSPKSLEHELHQLRDQVAQLNSIRRRFVMGVVMGLGSAIGATIVASLVLLLVSRIVQRVEDLPFFGSYINSADIEDAIETERIN